MVRISGSQTRGFWNVRREGKWYRIRNPCYRINSLDDPSTYSTLQNIQDGFPESVVARPIPFPLPLRRGLHHVCTLDLDSADVTISFWHREEKDEDSRLTLYMRRLSLDSINDASDLGREALLQNGSDPFLHLAAGQGSLQAENQYEHWETKMGQPSPLNELQYRMFMDFVYQWRFFIDYRIAWKDSSSLLFRRLCYAFLRLAAWDLEISSRGEIAHLPLGQSYPDWDSPQTQIYWFHRSLVIICNDLGTASSISAAISQAREFVGGMEDRVDELNCILISVMDIALVRVSGDKIQCSPVLPLLTNSCTTECPAGFRILTYALASPSAEQGKRNLAAREVSSIVALPMEVRGMVFNEVTPYDIVSFAQASFLVEDWYYSSLPQLPNLTINHLDISIPCCGRRPSGDRDMGVYCSICYTWRHLKCLDLDGVGPEEANVCSKCRSSKEQGARPKLVPGGIARETHRIDRLDGCRVMIQGQGKVLQLRTTLPAARRPDLLLTDPYLMRSPRNQIDYVVLFGGTWSGLAFGLDYVGHSV